MALRLACLLTLAFFSANVFAGDVLRFTFNPPNGTEFVETVRSTKTVSGTPKEAPDVDVTETRGAYSILKTQDGYLVKTRAVGPSDTKASPKVEAIQNAILDMKLTYVLDRRGHLQRIMGLESTLRAGGMYETASSILQLFGITDVKAFVEQQWVARELFIAGAVDQVETDRLYELDAEMSGLGGIGPVNSHNQIKATYPVTCSGRRCARLESTSVSEDPKAIESLSKVMYSAMAALMEMMEPGSSRGGQNLPKFQTRHSMYSVREVRLVYPETSLPYSDSKSTILSAEFRMSNDEAWVPVRIEEKVDYSYNYR